MGDSTGGATVLVVDDDRKLVDLVTLYLRRAGYQVVPAYDGDEALRMVEAHAPDLVVLDLMLPRMDGLDVCHEIRQRVNVPVIMLTARSTEADKLAGLDTGVAAVVLAVLLSRRILGPVDAPTAAARRMAAGDLSQRVAFTGRDEIGALGNAFNAMADSLGRHERLRRNMVTDVAHELRTPLTNVRGYLEALRDGVAEPTPQLIDSVYEEALLLSHLVDDLQELALAEAGRLSLTLESVEVGDVLERAVRAAEATASARGVRLMIEPLPAGGTTVRADAKRLAQVLRNLISNALRHTPAGGEVAVAAEPRGELVRVSVRDTGEGIAPEHLPFVFERFYRADRSRARSTGGTGIGLTIVKQLVEAHGGDVVVHSKPGNSATFCFTLPASERTRVARPPLAALAA